MRYRYSFNGKEDDPESVGTGRGLQDYGFRIYNPSLGKFLSVDPLRMSYPELTPYQFASDQPIWAIDLDGCERKIAVFTDAMGNTKTVLNNDPIGLYNLIHDPTMNAVCRPIWRTYGINNTIYFKQDQGTKQETVTEYLWGVIPYQTTEQYLGWSYSVDVYDALGNPITVTGTFWQHFNSIHHAGFLEMPLFVATEIAAARLGFWMVTSTAGGVIKGSRSTFAETAMRAEAGEVGALAEIKYAKNAYNSGSTVEVVARDITKPTADFIIDGVNTEVKCLSNLGTQFNQSVIDGAIQVGKGGQVVVVRPTTATYTMEMGQTWIDGLNNPALEGVTVKLVDEAALPSAFGK